jgi:hypothetical protein
MRLSAELASVVAPAVYAAGPLLVPSAGSDSLAGDKIACDRGRANEDRRHRPPALRLTKLGAEPHGAKRASLPTPSGF